MSNTRQLIGRTHQAADHAQILPARLENFNPTWHLQTSKPVPLEPRAVTQTYPCAPKKLEPGLLSLSVALLLSALCYQPHPNSSQSAFSNFEHPVAGDSTPVVIREAVIFLLVVIALSKCCPERPSMGNEGSVPSSEDSTPISEYPSMYSIHSRVRSSVESTRAPSPMEAPEPDLSHLTAEEVAQIRSVMERAKNLQQQEESNRARLEEEFLDLATKIEREVNMADVNEPRIPLCPICNKAEVTLNQDGSRSSMNVCVDCEKMTCTRCGGYQTSGTTRIQEWVCAVCDKRRRLMTTTGMWYHGFHPDSELPLERQIIGDRTRGESRHVLSMDTSMNSIVSLASSKDSRSSRDSSGELAQGAGTSSQGSRCGGDSGLGQELSSLSLNSELARQVYEQNRVKGPGATLPKSESDEFSDRTSDLDFDELASERSRPDGGSSTDESHRDGVVTGRAGPGAKRQKHRPKSLSLTRCHSHTSSDEEDGPASGDKQPETWSSDKLDILSHGKPLSSTSFSSLESSMSASSSSSLSTDPHKPPKRPVTSSDHSGKISSKDLFTLQDFIDNHAVNSPTPPRSPSWREGLDSPPFSPRRRDSYPGKRRGSLSPKEKSGHFTYSDISPPSRQLSHDELYCGSSTHASNLDNGIPGSHSAQKPSPMSPDEMRDTFISTMGESLAFDLPAATRARPPANVSHSLPHTSSHSLSHLSGHSLPHTSSHSLSHLSSHSLSSGPIPHSAPVMDLATYAATIANSTASLTSMSVSPTNLLPQSSQVGEPVSPDSTDSVDSSCSSPVSPGFYDNTTPSSDEVEEVELADPTAKSIDFQGSKRQKVRPPSTDWSPVIDLSPILDVSPSVEEAEQEDMLAKQMEELEKQRSRDEADEEDEDDEERLADNKPELDTSPTSEQVRLGQNSIPRIPPPPSAKKLKQQLNEEHDDYDTEELEQWDQDGAYTYSSSLKRCGNFEDISRLGSDNSLIKHTSELLTLNTTAVDELDIADSGADFAFLTCTTQAMSLTYAAPISTLSAASQSGKSGLDRLNEDQGHKKSKDLESLITDEIHKITEDMQNIVKRGAMDIKPIPPPKPKRRLPDPELAVSPPCLKHPADTSDKRPFPRLRADDSGDHSSSRESSLEETSSGRHLPRQDSIERKKAKDMKAKPSPILIQHIEAEEQSVSPHYKVMESPPTPEVKTVKREFSDSTSVSPSSSPEPDVYAFPSPVTPPDSDSSPPQPQSPSSPGTDRDEDDRKPREGLNNSRGYSNYENTKPDLKARGTRGLKTESTASKLDMPMLTYAQPKPEASVRPPISPRKSIRKFEEDKLNGQTSPVYENVQNLTTLDYLMEQRKNAIILTDPAVSTDRLPKGLAAIPCPVPNTHVVTYPLVGEFLPRKRSSSAPSTELQEETAPIHVPDPHGRPRSASLDYEQEAQPDDTRSVRDKIRAFEEIANKPKDPPRVAPKEVQREATKEAQKEARRDSRVMKDKRTDSGSSTSSSGSSAKTSSSLSSSDASLTKDNHKENKDGKKVRRKLPPIPVGEEPVLIPKSKVKRAKPIPAKRGEAGDQETSNGAGPSDNRRSPHSRVKNGAHEGFFIGPSNRTVRPQARDNDDSVNEDDLEVARLTNLREAAASPKKKIHLAEVGKSKSLDSGESLVRTETTEVTRQKPQMQRTASLGYGPKDETDEFIDSLISIYGIPCTEAMKSLKKRLQEELRRVTRDRKRKLEELEEIRALQMQIGALKLESDAYARGRSYAGKRSSTQQYSTDPLQDNRKRSSAPPTSASSSSTSLTPRSSPQVTPRRQRHKRQSSDPMISKFSPIKEDKDIEGDFQIRVHDPADGGRLLKYHTDDSSQSGISDSESTRSEPVRRDKRYGQTDKDYPPAFYASTPSSADRLQQASYDQNFYERPQALPESRSDQRLSSRSPRSRTSVFYIDDDETKAREDKKAMLQYEIMKRRQQLEETARLKEELLRLARARQSLAHSYDDIPRQYVSPVAPRRPVPRGIIKPIEDESRYLYDARPDHSRRSREHSRERSRSRERRDHPDLSLQKRRDDALDNLVMVDHRVREEQPRYHRNQHPDAKVMCNYSSTEYLAHKQESANRRYVDEAGQFGSQGWLATDYPSDSLASVQAYSQPTLTKRVDSAQSLTAARRDSAKKEAGIVSSVTLPNIYADRNEREFRPSYRDPTFVNTSISDTDGSPASDITPAMPLLDDVKIKSRTIIRNIGSGSRPVSAEFSAGEVEDLLNAMYRVESDNSVDADEPIMKHMTEGGVTILKQIDRKRKPLPVEPYRYNFPVKRILVTRDAKDKSITGNGLGMKIIGGKAIPGTREVGAFVTAIYPIIVDQLHGELAVGDQVLEWNGMHLTGLSAEEVHSIICQTNGEIEMVVRAQVVPLSVLDLVAQPESCRSSYDNLTLPTYEESVKEPPLQQPRAGSAQTASPRQSVDPRPTASPRQGVDPRQLAAQLEGIREAVSPAEQSPSSSHPDVATPSMSSPCSTPRSDPTSTSSDRQQRPTSSVPATAGGNERTDRPVERTDRNIDRTDRHSSRQRRRHSPNMEKPQHPRSHHSPRPSHHQTVTTPPSQQPQPASKPHTHDQQQHEQKHPGSQPSGKDTQAPQRVPASRRKMDSKPQQEPLVLPTPSHQDKPPPVVVDQPDETTCASPALNDRLRASPPLDTRRSVRTRTSKKENFALPTKPTQQVERGEDYGLGEIQLQISHDDFDNTLNIHVIQARNLRPRDLNGLSDPFVKLYLLPGRGPENKRRTKHIPRTLNPEWHQTVMFQDVARLELQNKVLEITVWDYDRFKTNDFLGELIIELREFAFLDNKPHWYPLKEHVTIQSFELPKSTVSPPKATENCRPKSKSPRQGKKYGISSLHPQETSEENNRNNQRKHSSETPAGIGCSSQSQPASHQTSSTASSPVSSRRPGPSKSPIKTKSNGLLYR